MHPGYLLKLTTRKEQWTYPAGIPFHMSPAENTALFALVHARVLHGRIGIGVLDRETKDFRSETVVHPGPAVKDTFLTVVAPRLSLPWQSDIAAAFAAFAPRKQI